MSRARGSALATGIGAVWLALGSQAQPAEGELAPSAGGRTAAEQLQVLREARDSLITVQDFGAAQEPAKQVIALQEPRFVSFEDYARLARIEAELGEFDAAELSYLRATEAIERDDGPLAITLVDVYRGLGRTYIKSGRYPEAVTVLEQARHITQRHLGLFNTEQTELIDDITTAYLATGDTLTAQRLQLERLDNAVRRFGPDDLRVVPFRIELADYLQRSRLSTSARQQYLEVLRVGTAELGADHPDLLTPLRQLVAIDLALSQGRDEALRARLAALVEQTAEQTSPERGLALAVLGDSALVRNDSLQAADYYRRAWDAVAAAGADPAAVFGAPSMIDFVAPLNAVDRGTRSRPYGWAEIVLTFDVAANGRPADVRVQGVSVAPTQGLAERYVRRVRETHFRPRLDDGVPVTTANVEFTHSFRHYVDPDDR